jgi:hypothetical protein
MHRMNPRGFMRPQAGLLVLTSLPLAFTPAWPELCVLIGTVVIAAVALAASYYLRLGGAERSPVRLADDREVARQVVLIWVVAAAGTCASLLLDEPALWQESRLSVGAVAFAVFWAAVYIASLFDWYYVRAWRDGVVVPPPCKPSDVNWTKVTRAWWANRCLVVIVCYLAAICSVVALGLSGLGDTGDSKAAVASTVVAAVVAATTLIRLFYGNLGAVGTAVSSCALSKPDIALGDRLVGPDGFIGGYVWSIGLEGITLVLLEQDGSPRMKGTNPVTRTYSLEQVLNNTELEVQPYGGCAIKCLHVNADCQWRDKKDLPLETSMA